MTESPYQPHNGAVGVRLSYVLKADDRAHAESIQATTYNAYEKKVQRNPYMRLRRGLGAGNEVLLRFDAMPREWQEAMVEKFGKPSTVSNALEEHFELSGTFRMYYDSYTHPSTSESLTPEQVTKYTLNASVIDAVVRLKVARETQRTRLGGSTRGIWKTLIADAMAFQTILATKYGAQHTLPKSERHFRDRVREYINGGLESLVDGRIGNDNAQRVTPEMEALWNDMYSGQKHKPYFKDVARDYRAFLDGKKDVVNGTTGELYDRTDTAFREVDDRSVLKYLSKWKSRVATHSKRSGNRQRFLVQHIPHAKMHRPHYAGSIISVDDRQPPFKYASGGGNRMWMYMAQDLGSDAITVWTHGETKEGIILEFYRQMVRNYTEWGVALPDSIECESSLNASYRDTFLAPGAMFRNVRIIANDARSKRIERTFGIFRYQHEKQEDGFIPRVTAKSEANQERPGKEEFIPKEVIVQKELAMVAEWNNALHPDQELHPGMSRWDVFLDKQHPDLMPPNWRGLLPSLGYRTVSSMNLGRVKLQGKMCVVSSNGTDVALGDDLIRIMEKIEGEQVQVWWLDGNDGQVLRAIVQDMNGRTICELLDDMPYHRAIIEQTAQCKRNMELTAAYRGTVEGFIRQTVKRLSPTMVIETNRPATNGRFQMPGLKTFEPRMAETEEVPSMPIEVEQRSTVSTRTADRF